MFYIIMHQTVAVHDAIGNDIEAMYHLLNKNCDCKVYAESRLNKKLDYIDFNDAKTIVALPDTVVIYHHSVYWENGEKLLHICKGTIIFKYHNITPSHFFEPYNHFHYTQCKNGRLQTQKFIECFPEAWWISDSYFNEKDIEKVPESNRMVCPPFNRIEEWIHIEPDETILKELLCSRDINLLFVGRVVPNKGHLELVKILYTYMLNYGSRIKLRIIGKFDENLAGYNQQIQMTIEKYGLERQIEFIGEINENVLLSYYLGSDFYINASEHEGFCVPVLEAQFLELPVLSYNLAAVPETAGKNQIVLDTEAKKMAAAINIIYRNGEYYDLLTEEGKRNYNARFTNEKIKIRFLDCLSKIKGDKE